MSDVGECVLYTEDGEHLRVVRADPVTEISAELLAEIAAAAHHPSIELFKDVLTISGVNRTVVYRIAGYDFGRDCYRMQWPD